MRLVKVFHTTPKLLEEKLQSWIALTEPAIQHMHQSTVVNDGHVEIVLTIIYTLEESV